MQLSPGRRRAIHAALRDLLVRGGVATGVALGVLWALQRPAPAPSAACKRAGSDGIGQCFGDGLVATLMPYILAMGAGAIAGALIGNLLVGRAREENVATRLVAAPQPVVPAGRWMTARYAGECRRCSSSIRAGDRIFHRPGQTLCGACGR